MTTIGGAVRLRVSVSFALILAIVLTILPPAPEEAFVARAEETPPLANPLVEDPLVVGLETSSPEFPAGGSATLTATSTVPVEQIGATIDILDNADGSVVKSCVAGTTCVASVSFLTGGPREYVAAVQDVESAPVTVARAPWEVSLTSSRDVFAAGQAFTLKAVVNQNIANTGGAYAVHLVDVATGAVVKTCTSTGVTQGEYRCSVDTVFYTGDPHQYVAYVSDVTDPAVDVQAQSAAVTEARQPWSVELTSSVQSSGGTFLAGAAFTLSAVVNQDVGNTGGAYAVHIVDVTSGAVVKTCDDVSVSYSEYRCSVDTVFYTGDPHQYVAYVSDVTDPAVDVQAQSAPVTVSRLPWLVSLTSSKDVFSAGSTYKLEAVVNQDVGNTGGAYAVHIVDVTSGAVVKTCDDVSVSYGEYRCSLDTRFYTGDPHQYVAYVSAGGDYESDVQAESAPVSVSRVVWTVSLSTSRDLFPAGQTYLLKAVVNQDVGNTGGAYAVHIVDVTSGAVVKTCDDVSVSYSEYRCSVDTVFYTGDPHQYVAYVSDVADQTVDVQAQSAPVTVSRLPWTVSLTSSRDVFSAGQTYLLKAVVNQDVGNTGGAYAVHIVDVTSGAVVKTCDDVSVSYGEYRCSLDTRFYTGDPHQYVAYVSAVGNYETDVQATSNPVTVARKPWSATLTVDRSVFAAGQSYTLKATADQNVANTGGFYSLYIVDIGTGEVVKECTTGTSCSLTTKFYTGDPRSYRAFVASRPDGHEVDRQVATNSVNVARQAWQVSLDTVSEATPDSNGMVKTTFRATTNQNIGYTNSNYRTYIYDVTASRSIAICTSGTTCTGSTNFPEGNPHRVIAYVAGIGNPWVDQQAKSNAITAQAGGGAVIAGEVFGGANPAEACASTCRADPVNTQSGEFFETTTDIGLPGVGPNVSWTRTYSAQRAGTPGAFGYGWTASVGMAVESADTDPLALAQAVNVVQENGSLTRFIRTEDGTFEAPDRVFATLTYDPVDGYRYVRGGNEVFLFTPQGALTRIEDNNGNGMDVTVNASGQVTGLTADDGRALTVTYANGRVTRVEDSTGREATYTYDAAGDLTSVNGFGGTVSTYAYDANHRVVSMTKPGGAVTTNTYDADGRVIEQVDPIGRSTNFEYLAGETRVTDNLGVVTIERYSNGQLTSMTSAAGTPAEATVSYTYTSSNQVASMTDALGRVAYYSYDARGNRVWIINTLGAMTKFAYDENGHLVTVTNALNQVTTFENDAKGNPVAVTDALGNRTVNTLNEKGQVIAVTDALGRTSTVEHDAHGRPIAQVSPGGVRTEIEYDALGLVTATVDPRGTQPGDSRDDYRSTYAYNALGLRTSATDPLGNSMSYSYDNAGRTTSTTDALGHATTLTYDAAGQILTSTDASGATTSFAYDGVGRVTAVTAPDGSTVSTVYDAAGRPTQSIDALGNATSYTYDAAGQLLTETSPEGRVTTYAYDAGGNVKKVTDPAGGITTMAYDLLGRVTSVTDPDGRTTMTTYDAAGRVVQTRRSDGATEGYVYDAAGQVTSSTDVNGRVTTYAYDADGNVVSSVDFAGRTTSATYVDGFPVVTTDAAGETTTTSYDVRGLATGVTYSSGLAPSAMVYDALGRVTSATDGAGQTDYTYDVLGRVTAIEGPTGDVGYAYNAAGNVASVTYPGGRVVERTYDAAGRVTGFESDGVGAFGVVWTADGLVDAVTYPNGVATDYTYDLAGRATDISVTGSAGAVLELGYAYTPGSLMSSRTTARDGGVAVSEDVTWDAAARLSTISSMSSGVPVQYTPSSEVMRADDGALLAWGADGSLTSRTVGAEVTAYASDGLGRRTSTTTASGDSTSFGWDQVGRMTGLADTVTGSVTDYSYSGGLRVGAATTVGGDTSTEAFTWDTLAGVPLLLSDSTHEYIYGLGTAPVAQVDTTTGEVVFLHGDLIGSTRSATDVSGAQVGSWDYSVFGETLTATGGAAGDGAGITRFLFAGEYLDDTGLYYLRARFYDPVTASFLSVDPALSATGSPYAYASGNPLQLVDPLGLWSMPNPFDSAINSISNTVKSLTSWGSVSDLLGTVACEVSGGFFWPDTGRNINLMLGFANHAKDELRETWREVRYFMNIKNPVSAIPAEAAMNVAVRSGAECEWESTEKFWVCYGADAGYVPDSGGTMYGAVFVTPWSKAELEKKDREQNRSTIRHEAKHGDIEAFIGSPGVGVLVLASGINNTALDLVIRQDPMGTARNVGKLFKCNGVEWSAGYQDGGYEECV